MNNSVEMTGKTIDDAVNLALKQLGVERDQASVEVLDKAKKRLSGVGKHACTR